MSSDSIFSETDDLHPVVAEFLADVDPQLLNAGWGFESAKSVEYDLTDQSMVNHIRNGVFALSELNDIAPTFGAYELDDEEFRQTVALFIVHDLHKLRGDTGRHDEYDIDRSEVEALVTELGVDEFAPPLHLDDFHACAVDHENSWNANPEHSTRVYDRLRPFVRVADAFASCATPEEAAAPRNEKGLGNAYPSTDLELRHHTLDDVKGVLTNVLNRVVGEVLADRAGYERLLIYQDGCVYLADGNAPPVEVDESLIDDIYGRFQSSVSDAHPAYDSKEKLAENISTLYAQNCYDINDQDFFYAGPGNIFLAVATKAVQDADPTDGPTESMRETMETLNERLPIKIDTTTRVAPGYARLVYTVKRSFVDPLVDAGLIEDDALTATCEVFDIDEEVTAGLQEIRDDDELALTAGGKWDYSYAIGQHIAGVVRKKDWTAVENHLTEFALARLEAMTDDWDDAVMAEHTGEFETELRAYIGDVLRVGGQASSPTEEMDTLSDPFEEHHTARRGKTCTFCNRGTTSTRKSDMEAPKSLTTFQAGYSNRIPAGAGDPDELLACLPCQVEFSLRETGATRREADRLFIHLVPDYFYTPTMWSLYADEMFARFTGEAMTRIGRLASAVFDATAQPDGYSGADEASPLPAQALTTVLREATRADDSGGRSMVEQLSQDFDPEAGFGARTLSFYKPQDNETEFQFFGVFIGLAVAASMGMRVYISQSPLPDLRGREFKQMAKLDAGFTTVSEFYGRDVPLSKLRGRLGAAAALIGLGYELKRDDARFAKYLRVTRNKPLPGSYLLKRAVQNSDDGAPKRFLLEEMDYLDRHANAATENDETRSSEVQ